VSVTRRAQATGAMAVDAVVNAAGLGAMRVAQSVNELPKARASSRSSFDGLS
jgi:hypothetical protein